MAFSASLLTSFIPQSIGPFHNGLHTRIYKYVFLNTGNVYDPCTGLFKNDQHIISTHGHQASGFISSSNGISLLLKEGDKVKVKLYPGQWIFDCGKHIAAHSVDICFSQCELADLLFSQKSFLYIKDVQSFKTNQFI